MADSNAFDLELADLVTRPSAEAMEPAPYSRKSADRRSDLFMPDGYRRYQAGDFVVEVSPWGLIQVRERDWLSKFAKAIHGDTAVSGRFARIVGDALLPIHDENLIETTEIIVHVPTFEARRAEEAGFTLLIDGRKVRSAATRWDGNDSVQRILERESIRREAESGRAGDLSAARALAGDQSRALESDSGFPGSVALMGVAQGKAAAVAEIRSQLDRWLASERNNLAGMPEDIKQIHFTHDGEMATKILLYEFLSGEGQPERKFDESHALTATIRDGQIGSHIARHLGREMQAAQARRPKDLSGVLDPQKLFVPPFDGSYAFSPDHTMKEQGGIVGSAASVKAHVAALKRFEAGEPIEFFVGGCTYRVEPSDVRMGTMGLEYGATVKNVTSLTSLFLHSPDVTNVSRDTALEEALREESVTMPYSSIQQIFHFYLMPDPRVIP